MESQAYENTDREIWREIPDDYYSPSIHVTQRGDIGFNVGGVVRIKSIREWHRMASEIERLNKILDVIGNITKNNYERDVEPNPS